MLFRVPITQLYRLSIRRSLNSLASKRLCSTLSAPHIDGTEKKFPEKIHNIVNEISNLTLIEVADLNELLKKTLNIPDTPAFAVGAMPAQATKEVEEEQEEKVVKTIFSVKLEKYDETKKVPLIKEIKSQVAGMNLVQSKKFVESLPQTVKADIPKEEAEALKAALEKVGGTVTID
ncbi:DgyrCDS14280 [Dimorphilus gyrociliatus]|uniref:DgyrCDS14280 n=1 Tax=Dimorphilus gyrociliatus TaxID=2664684 RepID=A0A7I8WD55_9ANNE|nr:DgyrCDS14280 [Dimorphilus gyrociliatus]